MLTLHFHLGVLIFVDTVEKSSTSLDLLQYRYNLRLTSTLAIVNLMRLTLCHDIGDDRSFDGRILLLDPYPENICQSLSRAGFSIIDLYKANLVPPHAVDTMFSVITAGLSILKQVSYSAQDSLSSLQGIYHDSGFHKSSDGRQMPSQILSKLLTTTQEPSSAARNPDIFQAGLVKELADQVDADPALVNNTIERCEKSLNLQHFEPLSTQDKLCWNDFDFLLQHWEFAVSLSLSYFFAYQCKRHILTYPVGLFCRYLTWNFAVYASPGLYI